MPLQDTDPTPSFGGFGLSREHLGVGKNPDVEVRKRLLRGGTVKELYEMKGQGRSIRGIARELGVSRNSVRKYLRSPGVPREKPRRRRTSKLDPYAEYIDGRLSEGLENCVVLLRELRALGYSGGYTILKDYVQPRRRRRQPRATVDSLVKSRC